MSKMKTNQSGIQSVASSRATTVAGEIQYPALQRRFARLALAGACSLGLAGVTARAANDTWSGASLTSSNWTDSANWNTLPVFGDNLAFAGTAGLINTNTYSGYSFNGLTFNSGASPFFLYGNPVTVTGGITNNAASVATLNLPVVLGANSGLNAASGTLYLNGPISDSSSYTLTAAGTFPIYLLGTNTFRGGLTVNGTGNIIITNDAALGATGSGITFAASGTLNATNFGATTANTVTLGATRTITVNSGVTAGFATPDTNNLYVSSFITGAGAVQKKSGSYTLGIVRFSNDTNNYTGDFSTGYGNTEFTSVGNQGSPSSLGAGAAASGGLITLNNASSSSTFRYVGTNNSATLRPLAWAGTTATYTLDVTNTGTIAWLNPTNLLVAGPTGTGAKYLTLAGSNTGTNTLAEALMDSTNGASSLAKSGAGQWVLTGTNGYSGFTYISGGTLTIGGAGVLGNGGTYAGLTTNNTGTLAYGSTTSQTNSGTISGTGGLVSKGTGTLTLSGINTYSGATLVGTGSTLQLAGNAGDNGAGNIGSSAITVSNGATLQLNGTDDLGYSSGSALTIYGTLTKVFNQNETMNRPITLSGGVITNTLAATASAFEMNGGYIATAANTTNYITGPGEFGLRTATTYFTNAPGSVLNLATVVVPYFAGIPLNKYGAGSLILYSNNTYSGNTVVGGGTLALTGAAAIGSSPAIVVATNALLDVSGLTSTFPLGASQSLTAGSTYPLTAATNINGNITSAGTVNISGSGTNGTLTINGSLALTGGTLTYDLGLPAGSDTIALTGATPTLTLSGTTTVTPVSPVTNGTYTLISGISSVTSGTAANLALATAATNGMRNATASFAVSAPTVTLTIGSGGTNLFWQGTSSGAWDVNTTANWTNSPGGTADKFFTADTVTFSDTTLATAAGTNVSVATTVYPAAVIFNNTAKNYSLAGAGGIGGVAGLTKSGTGLVTISNANTYTGGTIITAGTLQLATNNPNGLGNGPLALSGGVLDLNSNSLSIQSLSGTGGVITNTYITSAAALRVLTVNQTAATNTFAGLIQKGISTTTNDISLVKNGNGTLTITGAGTFSGFSTVNAGALYMEGTTPNGRNYSVAPGAQLYLGYSTSDSFGYGDGVVVAGSGTASPSGLYLRGGKTFQFSEHNVSALLLTNAPTTVQVYGTGSVTLNGGDVNYNMLNCMASASGSILPSTIGISPQSYGYRFTVASGTNNANGDLLIGGVIAYNGTGAGGSGGNGNGAPYINNFYKLGTGSVLLTNANTFLPGTFLSAGQIILAGGANRLAAGSVMMISSGATLQLNGVSQTFTNVTGGSATSGGSVVGGSATLSTLTINNALTDTNACAIGGSGAYQNNLALVKSGAGALFLPGVLTYTNNTTVSAGTLVVGSLTNADGATLSVVDVTGTLSATNLALGTSAGSTVSITGFTGAATPILVTNLTTAGTTYITLSGTLATGTDYPIIKYGTLGGAGFSSFQLGGGLVGYVSNNVANQSIDVVLASPTYTKVWQGNLSSIWDLNTSSNWTSNSIATVFFNGDYVDLDDTAVPASTSLTLNFPATASGFQAVNNLLNYSISGTGSLTGGMALNKYGKGSLTLQESGGDSYTGGITVSNGLLVIDNNSAAVTGGVTVGAGAVLQLGKNDANGSLPAGSVTDNGGLAVYETGSVTVTNAIGGSGSLTNLGTGLLLLTSSNSYTGGTAINTGTVRVANPYALAAGNLTMSGGVLDLNSNNLFLQSLSGTAGTISNSYVTAVSATEVLTVNQLAASNNFAGLILKGSGNTTNDVSFVKNGSGILTLSGASTFTGGTTAPGGITVNAGTLEVLNRSVDVTYLITNNAILKIGYTTGGSYANTAMAIYGNGTNNPGGLYLAGGKNYNVSGGVVVYGAPTDIRQYGSGYASFGIFDYNSNPGLCISAQASGSVLDPTVQFVNDGYGMVVTTTNGANTANGDLIMNGPLNVTGSGCFKRGPGSLLLNGVANAANGGLQIQAGSVICGVNNCVGTGASLVFSSGTTLLLNGYSQTVPSVTGTGSLVNGVATAATLTVNNASGVTNNVTFGGSGSNQNNFSLAKTGVGQLVLNGLLTYTGNTTVSGGILWAGSLTNSDGATLTVPDTAGTLLVTNLTLGTSAGSSVAFTSFASAASAPIIATNLTVKGVATISVTGPFVTGQYPLIKYTGGTLGGGGSFALAVSGVPRETSVVLVTNVANNSLDLAVTNNASLMQWAGVVGGVNNSTWDNGLTTNWNLAGLPTYFTNNDTVQVNDSAPGSTTLNLVANLSPSAVLVTNNALNFTFSATGLSALTGSMALTKQGAGALTITESNAFTGGVTIGGGAINLQNGYGLNGNTVTVASGAELQLQGGITVPPATVLALSGTGTNLDGGLHNISGTNQFGGTITLAAASRINSDSGLLTLTNGIAGGANAIYLGGSGNIAITSTNVVGSGGLVKDGAGTNTWTADANYVTGKGIIVSNGVFSIGVGNFAGSFSSLITVETNATVLGTVAHATGGSATMVVNRGTWLQDAEDYKQSITMVDGLIGPGPVLTSAGGDLRVGYAGGAGNYTWYVSNSIVGSVINSKLNTVTAGNNLFLNVTRGAAASDLTVNGYIYSVGDIIITGNGVTTFTGLTNNYSGWTTVSGGTLIIPNTQTGGGAITNSDGATLGINIVSNNAVNLPVSTLKLGTNTGSTLQFIGFTGSANAAVNATNLLTAGTVTVSVTNSVATNMLGGQWPLVKYTGTIGGAGYGAFTLGTLPYGVVASLVNNSANHSVDLNVISTLPTTNTVTLLTGANPSTYGASLTFQATLSSAPTNGETVTFYDGATSLGSFALTGGVATYTTSALVAGAHNITAVYGGDGTYGASTSAVFAQTVNPAPLTITALSTNETFVYGMPAFTGGNGVTYAGFVNGETNTVLGGTLAYGGTSQGATNAGVYTIVPSGLTNAVNPNYTIGYVNGALTISQATPVIGLGSSLNPAGFLDSVSFTATLQADATGSVVFSSTNGPISTNTLSGGAAGSASITNLARGVQVITAVYGGDGNYLAGTNTFNQTVTNHPPVTTILVASRTAGFPLEIALTDIATNWTDADGDPVELTAVNLTSTNGASVYPVGMTTNLDGSYVITNTAYLGYVPTADVADQLSYSVSDGQGGTNIGYINIVVVSSVTGTNSITSITGGNPNGLTAYGIPGFTYITERSTNLTDWVEISTNTAATNGVISVSDSFSDLGGSAPSSAFYRLLWQP